MLENSRSKGNAMSPIVAITQRVTPWKGLKDTFNRSVQTGRWSKIST